MSKAMKKVAVVGTGTMSHGIAEVRAIHGHEVVLIYVSDDILRSTLEKVKIEPRWTGQERPSEGACRCCLKSHKAHDVL
jgi:3-hydroxyacyl-CoA dehydrogenase